ncbi:MAG: type I restriction endonuclease subunit R, partial [Tissierellia bacterium]|nr:type I restriction endonuclease subunit R [Tissierellia bacterium]
NSVNIILEKSFDEYMHGFTNEDTGEQVKGYVEVCEELLEKFPEPTEIVLEKDKKEFVKLFGELLTKENILRNFDEFENIDSGISDRLRQDMRSVYISIRESFTKTSEGDGPEIDLSDVEFQIDLLKTDEINLDYILALILEKTKENEEEEQIKEEIRRVIRSSLDTRSKENLIMEFIEKTELNQLKDHDEIMDAFYAFGKEEKEKRIQHLINEQNLTEGENLKVSARRFILRCIQKGFVDTAGTDLDDLLPNVSRRKGLRQKKKEEVQEKMALLVEEFEGI